MRGRGDVLLNFEMQLFGPLLIKQASIFGPIQDRGEGKPVAVVEGKLASAGEKIGRGW